MTTNKRQEIMWRMWLAILFPVLAGGAIVFQSFKIQVYEGPTLRAMADSLTVVSKTIEAERGNIYSEDGSLLSSSLPFFEVRMDFQSEPMTDEIFNANVDSLALMMSIKIGEKSKEAYKAELVKNRQIGNRYYLVKRNMSFPELKEMMTWPFFRLSKYKSGMIVIQKNKRILPFGLLAERTIGFKRIVPNPEFPGKMDTIRVGIEGKFDEYLAGVEGQILMQRISGGHYIPLKSDSINIEPKAGYDVVMTLDINIQDIAETALRDALVTSNADNGCAIVMEVATGKIKAIANLTYREDLKKYIEYYNYAIGANTEPGSTFKLMSMAALIDEGYVDIHKDFVNVEGGKKKYADRVMRDVHQFENDNISVIDAFAHSSNVGISKLVTENYKGKSQQFYDKLIDMHLNQPVGIEISGEISPTIHPPSQWSLVSLPWMSTGYEVELSPLQILTFYNAIANNGKMMKPYLVSSIKEFDNVIKEFEPIVIDEAIVKKSTVAQLKELLEAVFIQGSAKHLKPGGDLKLAGKTGTARTANATTNYRDKIYQASFAGYFPANKPMYSVVVVINNPRNGYYGGSIAGPVFTEIANKVYANSIAMHSSVQQKPLLNSKVLPQLGNLQVEEAKLIYNKLGISFHAAVNADYGTTKLESNAMAVSPNNLVKGLVPNLIGMDLKDALYLLENAGLKVRIMGSGKVSKQSLTAGKSFVKGQTISLELH